MEALNEKILKAIEEDLPKQVGEALQERLSEIPVLELQLDVATRNLIAANQLNLETNKSLQISQTKLFEAQARLSEYEGRESAFKESERKVLIAQMREVSSQKSLDTAKEIIALVFKAPEVRKTVQRSTGTSYTQQYNNGMSTNVPSGEFENTLETTTEG